MNIYIFQRIGLGEKLQETIDFPMKYEGSCNFALKPIHSYLHLYNKFLWQNKQWVTWAP